MCILNPVLYVLLKNLILILESCYKFVLLVMINEIVFRQHASYAFNFINLDIIGLIYFLHVPFSGYKLSRLS